VRWAALLEPACTKTERAILRGFCGAVRAEMSFFESEPARKPVARCTLGRQQMFAERAECPEIMVESMPARVAISFRRRASSPGSRGHGFVTPFFRIALNTGPVAAICLRGGGGSW
jgi:hypothetical protein